MKVMSKVSVLLGILLVLVGLVGAIWGGWIAYRQFLALDALRSAPADKPVLQLLVAALGLLLGGFLLGLGIGRPRKEVAPIPVPPNQPSA
ncbi:MAG: hypothetical protein LCH96_11485 [Actinobacteria bacterium]|nr:hypothetical protein [Actinomycetota bacterium]